MQKATKRKHAPACGYTVLGCVLKIKIMDIYAKAAISGILFLLIMWVLVFPDTKYAEWLTNKSGSYSSALFYTFCIGISPLIIIGIVYLWCEL